MIIIGIDFSIQFPAVCISRDFKSFKWVACINTAIPKIYRKFLEDIESEHRDISFVYLDPREKIKDNYSAIERSKLVNYSTMVDSLVSAVNREVAGDTRVIVAIEGISYGAQGNALLDICQSTGMMRKAILDRVLAGHGEKVFIFSPGELKNVLGAKGNAGKYDVYRAFINNPSPGSSSQLIQVLDKYQSTILKGTEIKSPFMDMIDAYAAVLKVHELLKEPAENVKSKS